MLLLQKMWVKLVFFFFFFDVMLIIAGGPGTPPLLAQGQQHQGGHVPQRSRRHL